MPAKRVDIPRKFVLDELAATEINQLGDAVNAHAADLDALAFVPLGLNQEGNHPPFATRPELERWLLQRLAGLVSTTPDAPNVAFDPTTRVLAASSPLGSAQIEYKKGTGAYQTYQPITVDDLAHQAGEWVFRIKAQAGQAASTTTNSPEILPKAAGVAAPVVVYTSSTRRLTASHNLGGTLLYSYQGSAFLEYLGAITVDNQAHDPNEWRFKRAASTGYAESAVSNSPAIAAAAVANVPPVATSNQPAAITLPASQVVLAGTGTDVDGTVVAYEWRQVTGPVNAVGLPATTQNVVASGLSAAGIYQFGFRVKDDKGAYSTEQFTNVTVNPAVVEGPVVLIPTAADRSQNADISQAAGAITRFAAFSCIYVDTNASTVDILVASTFPYGATVSVYLGNTLIATLTPNGNGAPQLFTVPLPGTGTRRLRLVEGGQQRTNEIGNVLATTVQKLTFASGTSSVFARPTFDDIWFLDGDSLSVGATTLFPERESVAAYLREAGLGIVTPGYGSRRAQDTIGTAILRSAYLAVVQAAFRDATGIKRYIFQLSLNDLLNSASTGLTKGDLQAMVTAWLQLLKDSIPGLKIYGQTLLHYVDDDTKLYNGYSRADWNTALQAAYNAVSGVVTIDGGSLVDVAKNSDGVHYKAAGYADIANNLFTQIKGALAQKGPDDVSWVPVGWIEDANYTASAQDGYGVATLRPGVRNGEFALYNSSKQSAVAVVGQNYIGSIEYKTYEIPSNGDDRMCGGHNLGSDGYDAFEAAWHLHNPNLRDAFVLGKKNTAISGPSLTAVATSQLDFYRDKVGFSFNGGPVTHVACAVPPAILARLANCQFSSDINRTGARMKGLNVVDNGN